MTRRYIWTRMLKTTRISQALNAGGGRWIRLRRHRTRYRPRAISRLKTAVGKTERSATGGVVRNYSRYSIILKFVPKLNASPVGIARIIKIVIQNWKMYGPRVVPKGLVDAQKLVNGNTPCLPHSRIIRDLPRAPDNIFPNELKAMRKFKPRTRSLLPRTFLNHKLAVVRLACLRSYLAIPAYHETLVNMYSM